VCARITARDVDRCHQCNWRLVELDDRLGRVSEAIDAGEAALACLAGDAPPGSADYLAAQRARTEGYVALLHGDTERALARLDDARQRMAPHAEAPWIALELATVDVLRARALHRMHRDEEAMRELPVALARYDMRIATSYDRAWRIRRAFALDVLASIARAG
jgi:hypothetical protein